jgi:hypothetical protein
MTVLSEGIARPVPVGDFDFPTVRILATQSSCRHRSERISL